MTGKLLSLFAHTEFVRRQEERAQRELSKQAVPVIDLGRGRHHCRRCSLDFDTVPQLHRPTGPSTALCPDCDAVPDIDSIEAFLDALELEK